MRNLLLSGILILILISCKDAEEKPRFGALEIVGLVSGEAIWDVATFSVILSEDISTSELIVKVGDTQLNATNQQGTEFEINTYNFPDGSHELIISHPQVQDPVSLPLIIQNNLVTVNVGPGALVEGYRFWLVISDSNSHILDAQKVESEGTYQFIVQGFTESHYQLSRVDDGSGTVGFITYVEHLPRGFELTISAPAQSQDQFGVGTIRMKNIPSHSSYQVSTVGTEWPGDQLPGNLDIFFNKIPSNVLVQWKKDDEYHAALSVDQLTVAGGSVTIDLANVLAVNPVEITLPEKISGTFSTYGLSKTGAYWDGYMVDIQLLEEANSVSTRQVIGAFEQVEAQLIFNGNNTLSIYRLRDKNLPARIDQFTSEIQVNNKNYDHLNVSFEGQADLFTLGWTNQAKVGPQEKLWAIFHYGNPQVGAIRPPDYSSVVGEVISMSNMQVAYGKLTESDVIPSYDESLEDLIGPGNYKFHFKKLWEVEFYFPGESDRKIQTHWMRGVEPFASNW